MHERLNTHRARLLFSIGLNSSQVVFWVLYYAVDVVRKNPQCVQALYNQLYPKIAERTRYTINSIDCALRRMCREMEAKENFTLLRKYLPSGVVRPTASELMTTWLLMAEILDAEPDVEQSAETTR